MNDEYTQLRVAASMLAVAALSAVDGDELPPGGKRARLRLMAAQMRRVLEGTPAIGAAVTPGLLDVMIEMNTPSNTEPPGDYRRGLVKTAAMIINEVDRFDASH